MPSLIKKLAHWILEHPSHHHYYRYEAFMDDQGRYAFYWRCTYILCDEEFVDEDGVPSD